MRNHKLRDAKPLPVETVLGAVFETRAARLTGFFVDYPNAACSPRSSVTVLLKQGARRYTTPDGSSTVLPM
jgi:hypothetical protein